MLKSSLLKCDHKVKNMSIELTSGSLDQFQNVISDVVDDVVKQLMSKTELVPLDMKVILFTTFRSAVKVTQVPKQVSSCSKCLFIRDAAQAARNQAEQDLDAQRKDMERRVLAECQAKVKSPRFIIEGGTSKQAQKPEASKAKAKDSAGSRGDLPPPMTYARALVTALNAEKGRQARLDKINRQKMACESEAAAVKRREQKEAALKVKYQEGYLPLADRKKAQKPRATAKSNKEVVTDLAAGAASKFVRWTHAQMRAHQTAILKSTGASKWFSAAERAAYQALSPSEKAKIRAERTAARQEKTFGLQRAVQHLRKDRVENRAALAAENQAIGCRKCGNKSIPLAGKTWCKPCLEKKSFRDRQVFLESEWKAGRRACPHPVMNPQRVCRVCEASVPE